VSAQKITPDDIRNKLSDIQGEATATVEGAKSQLIAVGAGVALVLVIVAYLLGRRTGVRKSTIIEVKRA
jgi:hypothetical protein